MAFINLGRNVPPYNVFILVRSAVKKLGLFDENIYPAYGEDEDYEIRRKLFEDGGGKFHREIFQDIKADHGNGHGKKSRTIKSLSKHLKSSIMHVWFHFNIPYIELKWGCRTKHLQQHPKCLFSSPFNCGGGIQEWSLNTTRRRVLEDTLHCNKLG